MQNETRITFPLTGKRPISFLPSEWPTLASGEWSDHDGKVESQAIRKWHIVIRVRQHADGRALVLGKYEYITCWDGGRGALHHAGLLLDAPADEELIDVIKTVGRLLIEQLDMHQDDAPRVRECVQECIGDLPATML